MFTTGIDARVMVATMSDIEKQSFPFALFKSLNDTAFEDVRPGWRDEMLRVFDRPVRLTLNAVNIRKASRKRQPIEAEIFIRDEAAKGTPPARYLIHQVEGSDLQRRRIRKPFENLLTQAGLLSANEFVVPGKSYPLNAQGNVPARVVTAILSDVKAARAGTEFSTPESRRRRERRRTKRGGLYFASRGDNLPRGIYERIRTGFGVSVRTVFHFVQGVDYRPRFDAYDLARELFERGFPRRFAEQLAKEVAKSKQKNRQRAGRR